MFGKLGRISMAFVMTFILAVSLTPFLVSAAVIEESFTDECNDVSQIAAGGELWEVIDCPYVTGEKYLMRKASLDPDPFGATATYTKADRTIKTFKFYLQSFKFDYREQVNVYVSNNGIDFTKIDITKTELVRIGAIQYDGGIEDVISTFEVAPTGDLPEGTTHIKFETLREYFGVGIRKVEITYFKIEEESSEPESSEAESTSAVETSSGIVSEISGTNNPDTGDNTVVVVMTAILVISAAGALIYRRVR
ncbi:MAG: hypothetical protein A2Y17_08125 [Clostridiales bacterium GWF2_38_85]|nr:MAG: hypothetical protein A2Y17_08125 [Clostridiales bacterium GWF2_38_85]HBL83841.1 hypothetical protein [Clostridiales bacterium]